ncbi:response regulator [Aquamicrobium sp. LC103]|nr:response regulator [Aquamicrobium sp. LC103]
MFNHELVLVVGSSPVNRIVISRIAERAGLKTLSVDIDAAAAALASRSPGVVLLDGGPDNGDCDDLLEELAARRLSSGDNLPFVVMLSPVLPPEGRHPNSTIDLVVAKPITPDRLQPILQNYRDGIAG